MSTTVQTSTTSSEEDQEQQHGRIWRLFVNGADAGTFTDLRRRNFNPGERLIDDQGHRRLVIAVLDHTKLRLGVSPALR